MNRLTIYNPDFVDFLKETQLATSQELSLEKENIQLEANRLKQRVNELPKHKQKIYLKHVEETAQHLKNQLDLLMTKGVTGEKLHETAFSYMEKLKTCTEVFFQKSNQTLRHQEITQQALAKIDRQLQSLNPLKCPKASLSAPLKPLWQVVLAPLPKKTLTDSSDPISIESKKENRFLSKALDPNPSNEHDCLNEKNERQPSSRLDVSKATEGHLEFVEKLKDHQLESYGIKMPRPLKALHSAFNEEWTAKNPIRNKTLSIMIYASMGKYVTIPAFFAIISDPAREAEEKLQRFLETNSPLKYELPLTMRDDFLNLYQGAIVAKTFLRAIQQPKKNIEKIQEIALESAMEVCDKVGITDKSLADFAQRKEDLS